MAAKRAKSKSIDSKECKQKNNPVNSEDARSRSSKTFYNNIKKSEQTPLKFARCKDSESDMKEGKNNEEKNDISPDGSSQAAIQSELNNQNLVSINNYEFDRHKKNGCSKLKCSNLKSSSFERSYFTQFSSSSSDESDGEEKKSNGLNLTLDMSSTENTFSPPMTEQKQETSDSSENSFDILDEDPVHTLDSGDGCENSSLYESWFRDEYGVWHQL